MSCAEQSLAQKKCMTQARACCDLIWSSMEQVLSKKRPADRFVSDFFRSNRQFGSRDRAFLSESLFAYYRWLGCLLPDSTTPGMDFQPRHEDLPLLILRALGVDGQQFPASAALCEMAHCDFDQYRQALQLAAPPERFHALTGTPFDVRSLIPEWVYPEFVPALREGSPMCWQTRSPLWVRVQPGRTDSVREALLPQGIQVEAHREIHNALRLTGKINLKELPAWKKGELEVQDLSSQCIGLAAGSKSGESWWDVCAGAGGKSLQLATGLGRKGTLFATDIYEAKLEELRTRARRARVRQITTQLWDETLPSAMTRAFDGILVDAPCSSSGRWRRNPELRWTLTQDRICSLHEIQFGILDAVANSLRPGGHLIYATCSVLSKENTETVNRFLQKHPEYELEDFFSPLQSGQRTGGMLQILPGQGDCDGAFVAKMMRNS